MGAYGKPCNFNSVQFISVAPTGVTVPGTKRTKADTEVTDFNITFKKTSKIKFMLQTKAFFMRFIPALSASEQLALLAHCSCLFSHSVAIYPSD